MFDRFRKSYSSLGGAIPGLPASTVGSTTSASGGGSNGVHANGGAASGAGSPSAPFSFTSKVGGFVTGLGRSLVPRMREEGDEEEEGGGKAGRGAFMGGSRFDAFFGRDDDDVPSSVAPRSSPQHHMVIGRVGVPGEMQVEVVLTQPLHLDFEMVFGVMVLSKVHAGEWVMRWRG